MGSRYSAISLLFLILNASFSIPTATSVSTFTVQIESLIRNELLTACDLDGRRFPAQAIRSLKQANFTVHLRDAEDYQTLSCNLRAGDKHGRFVLFDSLERNVSAYCAPDSVCQWKVVSGGVCLSGPDFNCQLSHHWS